MSNVDVKDFNDKAYNTEKDGMEKALGQVSIYEKDGVTTAYVFDWTMFNQRPALKDWVKASYTTIDKVVFGDNPDNLFNQLADMFTAKATKEDRGEKLYQGALYLAKDKMPLALVPEVVVANMRGPF